MIKVKTLAILVFELTILFLWSFGLQAAVHNQEELIKAISEANANSTAQVYSGTGNATVRIYMEGPKQKPVSVYEPGPKEPEYVGREKTDKKMLVDFWFKGQQSKSAFYEINDNTRGELTKVEIEDLDSSITFFKNYKGRNKSRMVLDDKVKYDFHRVVGSDFHPESLYMFDQKKYFTDLLSSLSKTKSPDELTFDYRDDGLLALKGEGGNGTLITFMLDPEMGYRPISYTYQSKNDPGGGDISVRYEANWKQYGSVWYIQSLIYEKEQKFKKPSGKIPLDKKERVEVIVQNFNPDAKIDDVVFTKESIDIPNDTLVLDRIKDLSYRHGVPEIIEEGLRDILPSSTQYRKKVIAKVDTEKVERTPQTGTSSSSTPKTPVINLSQILKVIVVLLIGAAVIVLIRFLRIKSIKK